MSGLSRLLAGDVVAGVYAWTSSVAAAEACSAAGKAGWRFVDLDTWGVDGKRDFLLQCKRSFDLPDWVGGNFDALADALSDVRAGPFRGVLVVWRGWEPLAQFHPRVFSMALSVFAGRVAFSAGGRFAVLLQSTEPVDLDLPRLES